MFLCSHCVLCVARVRPHNHIFRRCSAARDRGSSGREEFGLKGGPSAAKRRTRNLWESNDSNFLGNRNANPDVHFCLNINAKQEWTYSLQFRCFYMFPELCRPCGLTIRCNLFPCRKSAHTWELFALPLVQSQKQMKTTKPY